MFGCTLHRNNHYLPQGNERPASKFIPAIIACGTMILAMRAMAFLEAEPSEMKNYCRDAHERLRNVVDLAKNNRCIAGTEQAKKYNIQHRGRE